MEFKHNELSMSEINDDNHLYLKVNSRDRNIVNEPNPFDFKIRINKVDNKYTTYIRKGYFGSGNKWIKNENLPEKNWDSDSAFFHKTMEINNGATIEDPIKEMSNIRITEMLAPRYLPDDKIGYEIYNLEATSNPIDNSGIFLKGIDNTEVRFIEDVDSVGDTYRFFKIDDIFKGRMYLFSSTDISDISISMKESWGLYSNFYTDTLELNDTIYKIHDISNGYLQLSRGMDDVNIDFLNTKVRLPEYYQDIFWHQDDLTVGNTVTITDTSIVFDQSAEPLITYDFVKDSIIKVKSLEASKDYPDFDYNYFKISSVNFEIDLSNEFQFDNVSFTSSNNTITVNDILKKNINVLKLFNNIRTIFISGTTSNNNTFTIKKITPVSEDSLVIVTDGSIGLTDETTTANIFFNKNIFKTYPKVSLTKGEYEELQTYLLDADQTVIEEKVIFNGEWIYNTIDPVNTNSNYSFYHLKPGIIDLLTKKLFYVSLDPIAPSKSLITNNKLNNVIGVFYPSSHSRHYIFLSGKNGQRYTSRNLQNLRDLNFKLLYMDGTQVGSNLKNYSLDYLEAECKQTNITFSINHHDRKFN